MIDIIGIVSQQISNNVTEGIPQLPAVTLENLFSDLTAGLIFFVLMIAIIVRTNSEFLEKWIKGEIATFNRKYIATGIIAFFTALPLAMAVFAEAARYFLTFYGTWGLVGGLAMVAVYGYGWNHGTNKLASLIGHFFTKNGTEQPPTTTTTDQPAP